MFEIIMSNFIFFFAVFAFLLVIKQWLFLISIMLWRMNKMQLENIFVQFFHGFYRENKLIFAADLFWNDFWIGYVESEDLGKTWHSKPDNRIVFGPESDLLQDHVSEYFVNAATKHDVA